MAVMRINKSKDYTTMGNFHLRDKKLSLKAKGLMSVMLSLPDDWDYSVEGLCAICVEGRDSIRNALKELKEGGYLVIRKIMPNESKNGRIEHVYDIYESPLF